MIALRLLRFLLAPLVASFAAPYTSAQECVVVREGVPAAVIVAEEGLAARIGEALTDFRQYAQRMSGAELEVAAAPREGHTAVRLQVGSDGLPPEDASTLAALNIEGFLLRVRDGELWIAGRSDLGVQHGLYWLLERWGCRWLFPGEAGEVVPARSTLSAGEELQTAQQPFFLMRYLWYNYANLLPPGIRAERAVWERRNRLAYSLTGSAGHAYDRFVPRDDDRLFAEHPEYFPESGGRRVRSGQICTCHSEVRERAVRYALESFARNPDRAMVSMSPNDGGGAWRCPECPAVRSFSDAALGLANHVAEALQEQPATRGKRVAMYAYFNTARPPSLRAHENVIVFLATRFSIVPWTWLAPGWARKAEHLGIRDYASILPWTWTRPTWRLPALEKKVRVWRELGVEAVSVESGNDWGGWGLYHYVLARLLWDPEASVDQLVEDYLEKGFGRAAPHMRGYFLRWKCAYSPGIAGRAGRDLGRAWRTEEAPDVRRRLELQAAYLHHLQLLAAYRSAQSAEERVQTLRPLVAFAWRIAPLNIAHTVPLVEVYLKRDAVKGLGVAPEEFESWKDSLPLSPSELRNLAEELPR